MPPRIPTAAYRHLAWPGVALLLGLSSLASFHAPLTRFLDRAQQFDGKGITISATGAHGPEEPFDAALLADQEEAIGWMLLGERVADASERERLLLRELVTATIALKFEKARAALDTAQLLALDFLAMSGSVPAGELDGTDLEPLMRLRLAERAGDTVAITPDGRAFLAYIRA